jgi:hypothetical protein
VAEVVSAAERLRRERRFRDDASGQIAEASPREPREDPVAERRQLRLPVHAALERRGRHEHVQ